MNKIYSIGPEINKKLARKAQFAIKVESHAHQKDVYEIYLEIPGESSKEYANYLKETDDNPKKDY